MKESTKEWLGIKPADFTIYAGYLSLLPVYYSSNEYVDILFSVLGLILCLASCWIGMKPHPELGVANNFVKLTSYPAFTILFLYFVFLNFTSWQQI
jgi:hypothetical protein